MRVFLGVILGILLTILVAYLADAGRAPVCPAGGVGCPLVNWDEANVRFKNTEHNLRAFWDRVTGRND
ncbi:MAG TPA: hypothetical protein VKV77_05115 [Methylovirgula sp.]|nr:hypothetical protein [Methylovirgula sp.]